MNHKTPRNFVDLTGRRIGRLVVVRRAVAKKGRTFWLCQCDCGNTKEIAAQSLRSEGTQSCGCLQREMTSQKTMIDLTGKRFGRLTVLGIHGHVGVNHPALVWRCQCDCGKITNVRAQSLRIGQTRSCGCLRRESRINNIWKNRRKYPTTDRKAALEKHVCQRVLQRCRAEERGCELTMDDVKTLVFAPCHYCGQIGGREYRDYDRKAHRRISDTTIQYNGIDRIDSTKGYTRANVVPCCWDCNRAKGNLPLEQFHAWLQRVYKHLFHV